MNLHDLHARYLVHKKVTTDSRKIPEGSLFFALKGERHDGNAFAAEALKQGAMLAVVDDASVAQDERFVLVPDVLAALQALARFHRDTLRIPVVGLTGSNGKTTSKELVREVLKTKFIVHATAGNLNNHIGVPLTILDTPPDAEIAVIEMGANHLGEIAALCEIANPTHGFITNISKAHVGMFGSLENILRAKSELYQHLLDHKGVVWINHNDPVLSNMAHRFPSPVFYPNEGDYYHCRFVSADPYVTVKAENDEIIETKLTGRYNFDNIAIALCIGKYFGVDPSKANEAIRRYTPSNMRSQVVMKDSNRIILDAYNANPASMKAAIENLEGLTATRKAVILGDMFELGAESEAEHRLIGEQLANTKIDGVYLCGPEMKAAAKALRGAHYFESVAGLIEELKSQPLRNTTVLVKASRGMALEKVLDYL